MSFSPKKKRFLLLVLLIGCVTLGGGWWLLSSSRFHPTAPASSTGNALVAPVQSPVTSAACPAQDPQFSWQAGDRQQYTFHWQTEVELNLAEVLGTAANASTTPRLTQTYQLSGVLHLRIFDYVNDHVYAGFQLSPVHLQIAEATDPQLNQLLSTFFLVEFAATGRPLHFHFPAILSQAEQSMIAEVIQGLQFILPTNTAASPRPTQWEQTEEHGTGEYAARYSLSPPDCEKIHKQKLHYFFVRNLAGGEPNAGTGSAAAVALQGEVLESQIQGRLHLAGSWLQSFTSVETLEVRSGQSLLSHSRTTGQLQLRDFQPLPELALWQETRTFAEIVAAFQAMSAASSPVAEGASSRSPVTPKNASELDAAQLIERMQQADAEGQRHAVFMPYIQQLTEDFTRYPEQAAQIPTWLKTQEISDRVSSKIMLALELSGNPQSQAALRQIMLDAEQGSLPRLQAIVAAGGLRTPQPETIATLWSLVPAPTEVSPDEPAQERSHTALLSLGILSQTVQAQDRSTAEQVVTRLADYLEQTPRLPEQLIALKALDNSAHPDLLPKLTPYLTSPEPRLREAATRALRHSEQPQATTTLLAQLQTDEAWRVRAMAAEVLSSRPTPEVLKTLQARLPQEPDPQIRQKIIGILGRNKNQDSQIPLLLKEYLSQEASREVKKTIYRALAE